MSSCLDPHRSYSGRVDCMLAVLIISNLLKFLLINHHPCSILDHISTN